MSYRVNFRGLNLKKTLRYYEDFHCGTLEDLTIQRLAVIRTKSNGECGSFLNHAYFETERVEENSLTYRVRLRENNKIIVSINVREFTSPYKNISDSIETTTTINVFVEWEWEASPFIWNLLHHLTQHFGAPSLAEMLDNEQAREQMREVNPNKKMESMQQWNQETQIVTSETKLENDLQLYGGFWGTEPIITNRWTVKVGIDLESFGYIFKDGLTEMFAQYHRANQLRYEAWQINKAKVLYIFYGKYRRIFFSVSIMKWGIDGVKVQIEQYRTPPNFRNYVKEKVNDIIQMLQHKCEAQVAAEAITSLSTLAKQNVDTEIIYEGKVAIQTLNTWLRTYFQENQNQRWEVYKKELSWSIAERDIINLIDSDVPTTLEIAAFKVIPVLLVESFPLNEVHTRACVRIYEGADRAEVIELQSRLKQAFEAPQIVVDETVIPMGSQQPDGKLPMPLPEKPPQPVNGTDDEWDIVFDWFYRQGKLKKISDLTEVVTAASGTIYNQHSRYREQFDKAPLPDNKSVFCHK